MTDLQKYLQKLIYEMRGKGFLSKDREYNNLFEITEELNSEKYLMLREINCFTEILKSICFDDKISPVKSLTRSQKEKNNNFSLSLPHPDTNLDDVFFNSEFDKLILRIRNSGIKSVKKLSDILDLKFSELDNIQGVGEKYLNLWQELKNIYRKDKAPFKYGKNHQSLSKYLNEFNFDSISMNYLPLNDIEEKNIEKLKRLIGRKINIKDIIFFNENEYLKMKGVGKLFINTILNLKEKLKNEFDRVFKGEIDYKKWESELILPNTFMEISTTEIGDMILDDLDNFLDKLNEEQQEIFQRRWGFVDSEATLEEIAFDYEITRERVRQKESAINELLTCYLRFSAENIWLNIKDDLDFKLQSKMENLSSCFDKERNFYKFLEFICGEKDIQNVIKPNIRPDILNVFFVKYGSPITYGEMVNYIEDELQLANVHIDNLLYYLSEINRIKIDNDKIYPLYLKKNEAAACILRDHPNGLPWFDVASLVNKSKISKTDLNVSRPDNQALKDSDYIYLAGNGVYKNTQFINSNETDKDAIFNALLLFFNETERHVFHLNEAYLNSSVLQLQDYYVIRYIVKMYGQDYGFYFDGKSQADSVSLKAKFENVTQKEVILQAMLSANKPMTKPEIASLLKSKSLNHASCYLDEMINNDQVVQVDRQLYTMAEIAYKDIYLPDYVNGIQDVLKNEKKPVEPSIIQEVLNEKLKVSYSKYFYTSIAKKFAQERNWFRKNNLYSLNEIPYTSLKHAISIHFQHEYNTSVNVQELKKYIAISDKVAQGAIYNWIHGL
ncbi:MAG: sigma factor-like helix-turn-helix DNA-binding protein [Candidatus Muiribacteriota bacterium]